mgnify:CR=1 FL=1
MNKNGQTKIHSRNTPAKNITETIGTTFQQKTNVHMLRALPRARLLLEQTFAKPKFHKDETSALRTRESMRSNKRTALQQASAQRWDKRGADRRTNAMHADFRTRQRMPMILHLQ